MEKVLFIGNSHTYFNDMPEIFKRICKWSGREVFTVMIAHGGVGLDYHIGQPEAAHNIVFGGYDVVVLQHTANPLVPETLYSAGSELARLIHKSGAKGVSYMAWPTLENRALQKQATDTYIDFTVQAGLEFAPAGEAWWKFYDAHPEIVLFRDDNQHATKKGSYLAACCIYCAAFGEKPKTDGEEIHELMAETAYETYMKYKV